MLTFTCFKLYCNCRNAMVRFETRITQSFGSQFEHNMFWYVGYSFNFSSFNSLSCAVVAAAAAAAADADDDDDDDDDTVDDLILVV